MLKLGSVKKPGGLICQVVLCRDVVPLFRMCQFSDASHSVGNICVKPPGAVVYVSKYYLTTSEEVNTARTAAHNSNRRTV